MKEVYSPYNVTVTDVKPTDSTYHLALIAGNPGDIGLGSDILGIAPLAGDCSPQDNVISFSFANHHTLQDPQRINNLCWTAAQESAHAFGLDHEFAFVDGSSTCTDPMTYQMTCGGERFFRDKTAQCGEFQARACKCSPYQSSHEKLEALFGPGANALIAPPTSKITFPAPNPATFPAVIAGSAGSQRGIDKVELVINGSVWATQGGLAFTQSGQANPGNYTLTIPSNLPDSIVDIVLRASDDLGVSTDSAPLTLTKGAACETAAICAEHQKCDDGRCHFDAPVGEVGDACEYEQFCKSNTCVDTSGGKFCSTSCTPEADPSSCPMDLVCLQSAPGVGLCIPTADGGCCSASTSGGPWVSGGLALLVLACMSRRRGRFAAVRATSGNRDESC
jgi:hypothetical protein